MDCVNLLEEELWSNYVRIISKLEINIDTYMNIYCYIFTIYCYEFKIVIPILNLLHSWA